MSDTGWFADIDTEETGTHRWVPVIQVPGCCFPLPLWFETEAQCSTWIDANLVGAQRLPE